MRKHRVIRQEIVPLGTAFAFDLETGQFDSILVTWDNTSSDDTPDFLVLCPTANRPSPLSPNANFPGTPAVPAAFSVAYAGLGKEFRIRMPMPEMITIGVSNGFDGDSITLKVEGDEHENLLADPNPQQRSRS